MLNILHYPDFLISLQSRASLACSPIWAPSHMHTYDRINLAECSLGTRVRLYHQGLLLLELSTYGMIWNCKPMCALIRGQYGEVDVKGKGHSLSICYPVSNAAGVCSCSRPFSSPTYITHLSQHVGFFPQEKFHTWYRRDFE